MPARFDTGFPLVNGLSLQCCGCCQQINYPPRELCGNCLGDTLEWQNVSSGGSVQSLSDLHYSLEQNFGRVQPWRIASIKLDVGPVAFAHLQPHIRCGDRVSVTIVEDEIGNRILVATDDSQSTTQWLHSINFKEVTA